MSWCVLESKSERQEMAITAVALIILATIAAGTQIRRMTTRLSTTGQPIRILIAAGLALAASYATYLISPTP